MEAEGIVNRGAVDITDEAVQALVALGYSEFDAQRALEPIEKSLSTKEPGQLHLLYLRRRD